MRNGVGCVVTLALAAVTLLVVGGYRSLQQRDINHSVAFLMKGG
jgi:hypothetical protein